VGGSPGPRRSRNGSVGGRPGRPRHGETMRRLGRALRNDRAIRRSAHGTLSSAPSPLVFRRHHNMMYRIDELVSGMAQAAANGTLASTARRLARARDGNHPTQERCCECPASAAGGQGGEMLAALAALRPSLLARAKDMSGTCPVAAGMHDIARRDGRLDAWLVRLREKNGARFFEGDGGVVRQPRAAHNSGDGACRRAGQRPKNPPSPNRDVKRTCAGTGLLPVLPAGRGFTGVDVLRVLREERVRHCTPVRRTDNVVNAIEEHAAGTRTRVPAAAMEPRGECEHYTAVVVPGRDSRVSAGAPAGEGLAVFAAGAPGQAWWHSKGWGIETRCREPGRARTRTALANPACRAFCLAYSPVMPSAWAVAMAMAGMAPRRQVGAHSAQRGRGNGVAGHPPPGPLPAS